VAIAVPLLEKTSKLLARALRTTPDELVKSFRTATLDDLPQVLALRAQVLGADITWDDEAYLRWRYRLGRAQGGAGDGHVLVRGGELLGLIGTEDITLGWQGQTLAGVRVMDTLVRPDCADIGLGVWMALVLQSRHPLVLAVGANANSIGLVKRLFEVLPNRRIWVHVISFDHLIGKHLPIPWLARHVGQLASLAMSLVRAWALLGGRQGIEVEHTDGLPPEADALARAATDADRIEVIRSREQWAWRLSTPRSQFDIWCARRRGELLGMVITRRDTLEDQRQGWTVMDVVLDRRCQAAAAKALLWRVLDAARRQHIAHVSLPSCRGDLDSLLHSAAFIERPHAYKVMAWTCRNDALRAHAASGADWSFHEIHTDGG
jgi:hypothetical protein